MTKTTTLPKLPARGEIITCAFCRGTGKDPFGLLSELSACQVCLGAGKVKVPLPRRPCAFCDGTGIYAETRLTCTVCGGKGANTVEEPVEACPACKGTGKADAAPGHQPCLMCKGVGFVAPRGVPVAVAVEAGRRPERAVAMAGVGKKGGAKRRTAAGPRAKAKTKRTHRKARAA